MEQAMQILTSYESVEWFTPPHITDLVKSVMGDIELDPASHETPQKWIQAGSFYRREDDGLTKDWKGKSVFCNPPYGKEYGASSQAVWAKKMIDEFQAGNFQEGILLINSRPGYKWYEELWTKFPVCCARERIYFVSDDGKPAGQAKSGTTFVYFGSRFPVFYEVFSKIGRVLLPDFR